MDNLIKGAVNKIKSFATNTFKQAPQALQNYATAYGKVSPYVPFLPTIQTQKQVQQNWKNIGNTYNKLPTPVKKFGEGFVEGSTYGLYDMPAPKSQNNWEKAAYVGGYGASMLNPLNPANKVFGALNIGQKATTGILSKVAPQATGFVAKKLLPNVAGEIGQTAGYIGLKNVSEQVGLSPKTQGNFGEQLAMGLAGRGAFGVLGRGFGNKVKAVEGKIGDEDVKALGAIMKRASENWIEGKGKMANLNQFKKDIDLVDEILVSKYGATQADLKKIPEIDRVRNLFSMAMEDYRGYQLKKSGLVSNLVEQPSTPQGGVDTLYQTYKNIDDAQLLDILNSFERTTGNFKDTPAYLALKKVQAERGLSNTSTVITQPLTENKVDLKGFGDNLDAKNKSRAINILSQKTRIDGGADVITKAAKIEQLVSQGYEPKTLNGKLVLQKAGGNFYEVTKFESDYAKHLSQPSTPQGEKPTSSFLVKLTKDGKIKVNMKPPKIGTGVQSTDKYIAQQIKNQQDDLKAGPTGIVERIKQGVGDFKRKWIEAYAPLIDPVNEFARKNKAEILPTKNIDDQISRVLASDTIAARWLKDSGFENVVGKDRDLLGQYLVARDNVTGASRQGKLTGRDFKKDLDFVQKNPQLEEKANQITAMYRQLAQMAEDNGLLPKGTVEKLIAKNPNYVRWERIFSPDEKPMFQGGNKAVASIGKQGIVQKMAGSERAIENPMVSLINRAYKTFNEVERNKAADILTTYRNIPGNPYGLRRLSPNQKIGEKSTISVLRNGIKEVWEVNRDVADAAKNLNKEQMSTWVKVLTFPTRIFKAGTTTLRVPFLATNIVRDQLTAFINSDRAVKTSLLNPRNTIESLFEAVKHGEVFRKLEATGAMGTSFDIYRDKPRITLDEIAAKKQLGSKILYKITHPGQLLRSYENILARGEEFTRIQQFKGTYDALIKQGRTEKDALILAARAARQNTVDFNRFGELSRVFNWFLPYFNAGIQGSRALVRAAQKNPAGVGAKLSAAVFMPMIASTAWNIATPDRKQAYDDIQDWEKENNFIIIPPNPTKDSQGRWNIIKIPITPGLSNLANISRMYTLSAIDGARTEMASVIKDLIGTTTSVDLDNLAGYTPQIIKPGLEVMTNKNFYTGKDIVPSYLKGKEPEEQAYKFTSGTMRAIGKATGTSPLQVQHLVKGYLGSAATDIAGQIDKTLASRGVIPKEQASGMDIIDATTVRFTKGAGGKIIQDFKESASKGWNTKLENAYDYLHSPKSLDENGLPATNRNESMAFAQIRLANPQILAREAQEARLRSRVEGTPLNPLYELPYDRQRVVLTLSSLPPGPDKSDLQKANIEWLKQYWAQSSAYFDKLRQSGITMSTAQRGPQPSDYVQAQMDAKNWSDPQVRAYLDANLAYKNKVREELGLTPLSSGGYSKFGSYTKKPKKVSIKGVKKAKLSKFKVKLPKASKLKTIKKTSFKVIKTKQPKIKVKMPKTPKMT